MVRHSRSHSGRRGHSHLHLPAACTLAAFLAATVTLLHAATSWLCEPLAPARISAVRGGRGRRSVALSATAEDIKKSKALEPTGKVVYSGQLNPKLKSVMGSVEYRKVLELLCMLQDRGLLDSFLEAALETWESVDVFAEDIKGKSTVVEDVKRRWGRVWPQELKDESGEAWAAFSGLWLRASQSRLAVEVVESVLPETQLSAISNLEDTDKEDELLYRLASCSLGRQYVKAVAEDEEVQTVAAPVARFTGKAFAELQNKFSTQAETLGPLADVAFFGVIFLAVILLLAFLGVVKLPFTAEEPVMQATTSILSEQPKKSIFDE